LQYFSGHNPLYSGGWLSLSFQLKRYVYPVGPITVLENVAFMPVKRTAPYIFDESAVEYEATFVIKNSHLKLTQET
jgi:hypothetical protein